MRYLAVEVSGTQVPFRNQSGFDAATLELMTAIYDDVASVLKIEAADPRSSLLAIAIATAARAGERDPKKLREVGMSAVAK